MANSSDSTGYRQAGGAGGSIFIRAASLAGGGLLETRGGRSWGDAGSGGGGRIAVMLTQGDEFGSVTMLAHGNTGNFFPSAAGTVYLQTAAQAEGEGILVVDDNNLRNSLNT